MIKRNVPDFIPVPPFLVGKTLRMVAKNRNLYESNTQTDPMKEVYSDLRLRPERQARRAEYNARRIVGKTKQGNNTLTTYDGKGNVISFKIGVRAW